MRISSQRIKTEAAVQAGNTVILGGLIETGVDSGESGIPGLSRIPILGGLFGSKSRSDRRCETIILLPPAIVSNPEEARNLTDEYGQKFRALKPSRLPQK